MRVIKVLFILLVLSPLANSSLAATLPPGFTETQISGLTNPFTFAFQPGAGRLFINDVGQSAWEEINDVFTTSREARARSSKFNLLIPC